MNLYTVSGTKTACGVIDEKLVLLGEIKTMTQELQRLHDYKIFKIYDSVPKLMWVQFLKGASFGFGSFLGATLVVSIVVWIAVHVLSQIQVVPYIGEFVKTIMHEIQK